MNVMMNYIPLIMQGIKITLAAWIWSVAGSLTIGFTLGIISCNYLNMPVVRFCVKTYTFVAKGIPAYVHILIAYFVIPALLGIHVSAFTCATVALALCSGGYATEVVAAGINAIDRGQWDACFVLGYPMHKAITRIICPQAIRIIFPMLLGEAEQLLKSTCLLATIGVTELTRTGQNIISRELNPFAVYVMIACVYLSFSGIIQVAVYVLKRRRRPYGSC